MTDGGDNRLRSLFAPLEQLLASGGDTRLYLDPVTRLNGYGCRPFPRREAFTFASSTATSISERAYAVCAAARQSLLRDATAIGLDRALDARVEGMRGELKELLDLGDTGCEIVFSPSGTDSQLHALFLARSVLGTPMVSVIAAAEETGSGAAFATHGYHFNAATSCGSAVIKGEPIAGVADDVSVIEVKLRDDKGAMRPCEQSNGDILHTVGRTIAAGKRVLLFAMDSSKLGQRSPSLDCLRQIAQASGGDVQIVIDACQARVGRKRLRWYLEQGFMVLLTGSKFFTGAPFCGALLVPAGLAVRCAAIDAVPADLVSYTSRSDWPMAWRGIRAAVPERANLGQWLRWVSALEEMRDYFAVPASFREMALRQFAEVVPRLIESEGIFELVPCPRGPHDDIDEEEMVAPTIFPFFVRYGARLMSQAEATVIYRALNDDVARVLPAALPPMQRFLAMRRCHIGQPVDLPNGRGGRAGALRISAGARVVSETWVRDIVQSRENLYGEFDQVRAILEKIRLLVRHFDVIERTYRPPSSEKPYQVSAA